MMKPTMPISAVPSMQIFIESQSSLRPGLVARCNSLLADEMKDLTACAIVYSLPKLNINV
jgi:hypothetical protein